MAFEKGPLREFKKGLLRTMMERTMKVHSSSEDESSDDDDGSDSSSEDESSDE